jgi:hypothetical protein
MLAGVISDPIKFWYFALQYSPEIAELEYVFSKRRQTQYRAGFLRLTVERMHKLCFVHINRRILDRPRNATKKRLDELDEREAIVLESTLLEAPFCP